MVRVPVVGFIVLVVLGWSLVRRLFGITLLNAVSRSPVNNTADIIKQMSAICCQKGHEIQTTGAPWVVCIRLDLLVVPGC